VDASFNFLFLAFIGFFTFLLFWPGIWILDYTRIEVLEFPEGPVLWSLVLTIALDAIFNAAFFFGIYCTSPLFMAAGSLVTIPVSVIVDLILNNYILPPAAFFGMAAIVIGFLGLNLSEAFAENLPRWAHGSVRQFVKLMTIDLKVYLCSPESRDGLSVRN